MSALWPRINVSLQAVAQILLVIGLGVWLSKRRNLDRQALAAVSNVNWHALIPALMVSQASATCSYTPEQQCLHTFRASRRQPHQAKQACRWQTHVKNALVFASGCLTACCWLCLQFSSIVGAVTPTGLLLLWPLLVLSLVHVVLGVVPGALRALCQLLPSQAAHNRSKGRSKAVMPACVIAVVSRVPRCVLQASFGLCA